MRLPGSGASLNCSATCHGQFTHRGRCNESRHPLPLQADRQNESSIADQVRVCSEYADRQGWKVAEQYSDQGISGAALGNHPGVLKLQEAALARKLDIVRVTDLSRLSRSNGDLSKMIDRLTAKGVRVVGVQDGYDSVRRRHKLQAGLRHHR